MDLTIVLRNNWSCLNLRIWSRFWERDASLGKVIIAGGHGFKQSTKLSKSYPNRRYMN